MSRKRKGATEGLAPAAAAQSDSTAAPSPPDNPGLIDVKALIARYSNAEHIARADAYFGGLSDTDKILRKPFFGIADTQANMHGVAEVLQRLRLYPGARVLDFGAGTGWLSRVLAYLECQPIAVDVSAKALELGQRAFERDPVATGLSIAWRPFDGMRLPLDDEAVDRIVCYDSFHHVADQGVILREFYRVLAQGGRVVFHEPGPHHSTSPISQYEMRHHDVVENDIVMEDIEALATEIGFENLEVAVTSPRSLSLPLSRYNALITGKPAWDDVGAVLQTVVAGSANLRIFSFDKGEDAQDSRFVSGLAGRCSVTVKQLTGTVLHGIASAMNTGHAVWRPSADKVGGVSVGVHRVDGEIKTDFGRIALSTQPIMPGETVTVDFALDIPGGPVTRLSFDLVAEGVTWFELIGTAPQMVDLA